MGKTWRVKLGDFSSRVKLGPVVPTILLCSETRKKSGSLSCTRYRSYYVVGVLGLFLRVQNGQQEPYEAQAHTTPLTNIRIVSGPRRVLY